MLQDTTSLSGEKKTWILTETSWGPQFKVIQRFNSDDNLIINQQEEEMLKLRMMKDNEYK